MYFKKRKIEDWVMFYTCVKSSLIKIYFSILSESNFLKIVAHFKKQNQNKTISNPSFAS